MKTFFKIGVFLVSFGAFASVPVAYQYWVDNDMSAPERGVISSESSQSFEFEVNAANLSPGGHQITYSILDNNGNWGSPFNGYVYIPVEKMPKAERKVCQYWFDNDWSTLVETPYSADLDNLSVDVSSFSEGGHIFSIRYQDSNGKWGSMMNKAFYIPVTLDKTSRKSVAYREFINNEMISIQPLEEGVSTIEKDQKELPDNLVLNSVNRRALTYLEGTIQMEASGTFNYAIQFQSDLGEWGVPLFMECSHDVTTSLPSEPVAVPGDYSFKKVDNNHFKAYRFNKPDNYKLYLKASQDCKVRLYTVGGGTDLNNMYLNGGYYDNDGYCIQLYKDKISDPLEFNVSNEVVAFIYDTPTNSKNSADNIDLRIMYEKDKLPKPEISFDNETWTITIRCADQRAKIYYTLDGEKPTPQSSVYSSPIVIDKNITVRAYAVLEGDFKPLADSDIGEEAITNLKVPTPEFEYAGNRLFTFNQKIAGVTTYYTLDGSLPEPDSESTLIFDGNPFALSGDTRVRAYSKPENSGQENGELKPSGYFDQWIYLSNYIASEPYFNTDSYNGEYKVSISSNEGNISYRMFTGTDAAAAGNWIKYENPIPVTGNMTIQAYSEVEGKTRSNIAEHFTDWVRAERPTVDYDNFRLKLSSTTPGGKIFYYIDNDSNNPEEYVADTLPNGLDVTNAWNVVAYVEAQGYSRSDDVYFSPGNYNLQQPEIKYEDGYIDITHPDEEASLVVTFSPEQQYEVIATNHIRAAVPYSVTVTAYAKRKGYNDSEEARMEPSETPIINVDGYYVYISNYWNRQDIYYTTDGSVPTKESTQYDGGFNAQAGTIKAVRFDGGHSPSEVATAVVMDPTAMPEVDFDNGYCKLTTTTPNATIYYSLDIDINNTTRKKYDPAETPNGIDMNNVNNLYAYAEADGYRRSETLYYYKYNYSLSEPRLTYEDGYVTAEHDDETVTVRFTDENGNRLEPDAENPRRVPAPYNSTIQGYAYKKGYVNSPSVVVKPTRKPTIKADLFTVQIKSNGGQEIHYTTDGSTPTQASPLYESPFKVSETCTVRAVAFTSDEIPAEAESLQIAYKKSNPPVVTGYNGRYLSLSVDEGSSVVYKLGSQTNILNEGTSWSGNSIDLEGLNSFNAIVQRDDADDSDVFTFNVKYYANETDAYSSEAGHMGEAFQWCDDPQALETLTIHGELNNGTTSDNRDYTYLSRLPGLRHLDLKNVTDTIVPDSAFVSDRLLSVVLPPSVKKIGAGLFGDNNTTLCAVELSGDGFLPDTLLKGVMNPNLLLYARSSAQANELVNDVVKNVVLPNNNSFRAADVTLTHGNAFHAPKEFTAQTINFTRAFTKETQIEGYGSGWETMVVPFDVQSITNGGNALQPFEVADLNAGGRPFWLFEGSGTDWVNARSIEANTPYLVAFPNNQFYADEYNVRGDVVFSSNNVIVAKTPQEADMARGFGTAKSIVGNYEVISKEEDVLAINDEPVSYHNIDFLPGGIFIANLKDVSPFECYVMMDSGVKALPVFETSDVDQIMGEYANRIWSEGHDIYIRSSIGMRVRIYDTVGQLLRIVDVKAGETTRVEDFNAGLYIVGNTKIYVKG